MRTVPENWPADVPVPPPIPKRWFEDSRWLSEHTHDLAQAYPDQWVAIFNKEVVAVGSSARDVMRAAQEKTGEREIVVDLVSPTRTSYSSQHSTA